MMYSDRTQAGRALAQLVQTLAPQSPVVLALPRGGVPVAYEISQLLKAPLDLLLAHKVGWPKQPEAAMGAVTESGQVLATPEAVEALSDKRFRELAQQELERLRVRASQWRRDIPAVDLQGRACILVDDGLATGLTMMAGVEEARQRGAAQVLVAVPVGSAGAVEELGQRAYQVVCPLVPEPLRAVGCHYLDFDQVSEEEVRRLVLSSRQLIVDR